MSNKDSDELKCPKCGYNLENIKVFNDLIKYNKNINNILNELKSQIRLINIDEMENKKGICIYLINCFVFIGIRVAMSFSSSDIDKM